MKTLFVATASNYKLAILKKVYKSIKSINHLSEEQIDQNRNPKVEAIRIATEKVLSIPNPPENSIIIGIDQVSYFNNEYMRKPGNKLNQFEQLMKFNGNTVYFYTGVYIKDQTSGNTASYVDTTKVIFRNNSSEKINSYIALENATDCAGGFKIESYGPLIISEVISIDPYALQGVPLLWVIDQLAKFGMDP